MPDANVNPTPPSDPAGNPVVNGPFTPPEWHWPLTGEARAFGPANPGRRESQNLPPVAGARPRRGGRPHDPGVQWQPLPLVNKIRQAALDWRNRDCPGITPQTRTLLEHWTSADGKLSIPYFAQLDAVLTHIYCREVQPQEIVKELERLNARRNDGIPRICHKMATGTGKTLVMAMLIIWQTANWHANPADPRFTRRFLLLAPGLTVRERLESALTVRNPDSEYRQFEVLPPGESWEQALLNTDIRAVNYHQLQPQDTGRRPTGEAKTLLDGGRQPITPEEYADRLETPAEVVARITGLDAADDGKVLVINDESHHCHRGDPYRQEPVDTVWFQGIRYLRDAGRLHYAADLSATPTYITQENPLPVEWIVSDYSLVDAIEAGLTKIPKVPTLETNRHRPRYRDLWTATDARERGRFDPRNANNNALLKEALGVLYRDYARTDAEWDAEHRKRNAPNARPIDGYSPGDMDPAPPRRRIPVMAVVMNSVANANNMFQYIADGHARAALLENPADDFPGLPNTIIVHSRLEDGEAVTGALAKPVHALAERYRQHKPYGFSQQDGREEIIRRVMNTVGKPGQPGEHVRCVISVGMLTEGWDARTVTHLLGFRKFGSALLCEQVAGRTLRRTAHDLSETTGHFAPEYAQILGVPFPQFTADDADDHTCPDCRQDKTECQCPPPYPLITIEPRDSHAKYRVEWPNIVRMDRASRDGADLLRPLAAPDEIHQVPELRRNTIIAEGIVGYPSRFAAGGDPVSRERFLFLAAAQAANDLLAELAGNETENAHPIQVNRLFAQVLAAARDYGRRGYLIGPEDADRWPDHTTTVAAAAAWLRRNLELLPPGDAGAVPAGSHTIMTAIPSRLSPWLETGELRPYDTWHHPRRIYGPARKAEINYAHCDSGKHWEPEVARQLDEMPEIARWARNYRLNWHIPWLSDGQPHRYLPDFVAVAPLSDAVDLNLVIEVKGYERPGDDDKRRWARQHWIPAVNNHPDYGLPAGRMWRYLYLDDAALVAETAARIRDAIAQAQAELI